jgi:phosphoserine phosphatase
MRGHGAFTALVSGGFRYFTGLIRERVGFDYDASNELLVEGTRLTGRVGEPILDRDGKLAALERLADERGIDLDECLAVGDGANDIAMIKAAGLGVAYRAKPAVAAAAGARLDHADLTGLLYLQGYSRSQFLHTNR